MALRVVSCSSTEDGTEFLANAENADTLLEEFSESELPSLMSLTSSSSSSDVPEEYIFSICGGKKWGNVAALWNAGLPEGAC